MLKSFVKDLKHTENINVFRKITDRGGGGARKRKNQNIHSSCDFITGHLQNKHIQ